MKTTTNIEQFKGYDRTVAECHISNWGTIYLDEYDMPMEVEDVLYMLEEA